MRDVLLHYREVLDDAEQKAKSKMLFIQVSFLLIYFLFLSVGSFYGLFEAHRSYSIFVFICGLFGFLIFKNRKVGSLKDTLDQQLEKIDQAIREMNTLKDKAEWVAGQKND